MKKMKKLFSMLLALSMTAGLLSMTASAEEYACGRVAHAHNEDLCYEDIVICGKHAHEEACYEGETLICGKEATQDLVCEVKEHEHTVADGCYHKHSIEAGCFGNVICGIEEGTLVCEKSEDTVICGYEEAECDNESEEHEHTDECDHAHGGDCYYKHSGSCYHEHDDDCYGDEPVCGLTEEAAETNLECKTPTHTHDKNNDPACYVDHTHVEDCYETDLTCELPEHEHVAGCAYGDGVVAIIGETPYKTLSAAVDAAEKGAVIVLVDDAVLDAKVTIDSDVTITSDYDGDGDADYAIVRGESYSGTLISVSAGAKLTMDNLDVDGNNKWTFLEKEYWDDLLGGNAVNPDNVTYSKLEKGAPVASAAMIEVKGTVLMDGGSVIHDNAGEYVFSVAKGGTLTTEEALITHNFKKGVAVVATVGVGGTWNIEDGTEICGNYSHHGNGGMARVEGTVNMNGGEIYDNAGIGNGGIFIVMTSKDALLKMNGGEIYENWCLASGNNWNGMIYLHDSAGAFEMNGGEIHDNITTNSAAISAKHANLTSITLDGGKIYDNIATSNYKGRDIGVGQNVKITADMFVEESRFYKSLDIAEGKTLFGDVFFNGSKNGGDFTGGGTIDGDVTVTNGRTWNFVDGTWDGLVTVNSVGTNTLLNVKADAVINGVQVRVLGSVASGDSENESEAATEQSTAYSQAAGASVNVPVLYYHRLTSAQQKDIVITYDYNGGLDASGWSGCQRTGAGDTYELEPLPEPTRDGLDLIGWKYAKDNNPESLSMAGSGKYEEGTPATESIRLIAQWGTIGDEIDDDDDDDDKPTVVIPDAPIPTDPAPETDGPETSDETPAEEIVDVPEENVPLADVPKTGDMSALWLALSALSGTGLAGVSALNRKKRDEE
ncbi:MAG: LPXTG cell wall anchor domain-containing protein [Oscillospiraceae bacterium]|nr:LPXTG cell wall anchor domain-containing protein [Oscillospiraceae bacterium]